MLEQAEQPVERVGKLVPSASRIEESKDVEGNDRIGVWSLCIEVGLPQACSS